jgi:hypothetical protein
VIYILYMDLADFEDLKRKREDFYTLHLFPISLVSVSFSVLILNTTVTIVINKARPPLWSSGQSSWLEIQSSGFDSRRY